MNSNFRKSPLKNRYTFQPLHRPWAPQYTSSQTDGPTDRRHHDDNSWSYPRDSVTAKNRNYSNKIHVQTNTKSVQCLCINTKHNKVRIPQSQWTSRKHAYWRSLRGLSGKWKWSRQMARPWKPPAWCKSLGHNSYTSHIVAHFMLKFQHFCYYGSKGRS